MMCWRNHGPLGERTLHWFYIHYIVGADAIIVANIFINLVESVTIFSRESFSRNSKFDIRNV